MSTATAPVAPTTSAPVPPLPNAPTPPPARTPQESIQSKIAAAFQKPDVVPPVVAPKAPAAKETPVPATPETPKTPEAKVEPVKPTLLPRKKAEAPATPAPSNEPDPDAKFGDLPETAPAEQRAQWTELKKASRERLARIKELESKVNAPVVPTAEVERLRAEHKAAMDRLAVLDLQSHPDFKRQYEQPKTKALAEVQEILAYSGKEATDVPAILSKNRKDFSAAVTELTKDLNPMDATTVQTALRDAYRISAEERTALANGGELRAKLQQQAEAQARQAFEEVSSNLGPIGEFLVPLDVPAGAPAEEVAEITDYNNTVANMRQHVEKTVFGPTNEKSMAVLGWKASTLDFLLNKGIPRMEKTYSSVVAERDALARELAAMKGVKGGGPIAGDPAKGGTPGKQLSMQEKIDAARAAGAFGR